MAQLNKAADLSETRELSELEKQGLIQSFEFTHELAWNVMKDFFITGEILKFMEAEMPRVQPLK